MKKALFLDRDGVINHQIVGGYVTRLEEFEFHANVLAALEILADSFDYIFIVTNQQGIGKGVFSQKDLDEIHQFMLNNITENGGRIDKIYVCPDLAKNNSTCRKPNIGMGIQALRDFPGIEVSHSVMVGDTESDMEFGRRLGLKTIFLTNGNQDKIPKADFIFNNLWEFATAQATIC
ncbi:MAG: HAD family hydrolase [Porphyromonadaceae bacterium]|jgi:histidinol-phosphate phosphatase family protein|nr:HAD family hydrolase [Porphyromonadaceae bacterium]